MPDKNGLPSRARVPSPPGTPSPASDQKQYNHRGASSRTSSDEPPPGTYNDLVDLPANYYDALWREKDHANFPDPRDSKKMRDKVAGWRRRENTTEIPFAPLALQALAPEHIYRQDGGYCMTVCAAFYYFRRLGMSPAMAISALKSPWVKGKIPIWYGEYYVSNFKLLKGESTSHTAAFTTMMHKMNAAQNAGHLGPRVIVKPIRKEAIWSCVMIGAYPDFKMPSYDRRIDFSSATGSNSVALRAQAPNTGKSSSLQQALFSRYQEPRAHRVPSGHKNLFDRPIQARRMVCSTVLLSLQFRRMNTIYKHVILVDFSDRRNPGIFDPNFGWITPQHGYCYLLFELSLNAIWEFYTEHNSTNLMQGVPQHEAVEDGLTMTAFQLYEQDLGD